MYPGQLDVLHHCRYKGMLSVSDGIRLALGGMTQEPVDQNRTIRSNPTAAAIYCFRLSGSLTTSMPRPPST